MDKKDYYLLEFWDIYKKGSFKQRLDEFNILNNTFFEIVHSLFESKSKIKLYHSVLEGKYIRFGFANLSLLKLCEGVESIVRKRKIQTIDLHSIYSICRMQIENYLMSNYLFYDEISDEEKEFRYLIYKLHGLNKQNSFPLKINSPKHLKYKNDIQKDISATKLELSKSKYIKFHKLVKNLSKPSYAKYIDTKSLFKISDMSKGRLYDFWGILSNYIHSEYISDRQFSFYRSNINEMIRSVTLSIEICSILTSKLSLKLANEFVGVKLYYNTIPPRTQVAIETWEKLEKI